MRELLTFQMPATQSIELGANTIHAITTIDRDGQMVGDMMPYQDRKGKMVTPTMPNRGPQVIAIAGSDTVQYFNPDHERHYRSTIDRYEDVLVRSDVPEVRALLAFAHSGVVRELDFSQIKVPKDKKTQQADFNKVQRLNYLGNSDDNRLSIGSQNLLIWTDGASLQPLLLGLGSSLQVPTRVAAVKKTRKKGSIEPIEITDTSLEGIKQRLLSLWKGTPAIAKLDTSHFYATTVTAQNGRLELTPIRKAGLVKVVENIANYHAKQLRFSPYSRPHWGFLDALYPVVTSKNKPYTDRDRGAIFDCAVYGTPLPRALVGKALGRLKVEGVPIASTKHQITVSNRAYTQLSFLSLEIPMTEITELPSLQRQAYALGRLYSYACRQADKVSNTPNHGVRKLWGQINRNPKRALYQLAKRFPIYVAQGKDQAIFNTLYRAVMEASSEVPERVDLDYGVAFMWGVSATAPKSLAEPLPWRIDNKETEQTIEDESK